MSLTWVPIEQAREMVLRGEVKNSIAIAGIMVAGEVITGRAPARSVDEPFDLRPESLPRRRQAMGFGEDMKRL